MERVAIVAARVSAKNCRSDYCSEEEEQSIERVEYNCPQRWEIMIQDSGGDEEDERKHRKHGDKHVEVDDGGIATKGGRNYIADERHNQQRPEEL